MSKKLITYPNEILSQKAVPVDNIDGSTQDLVQDMSRIMYDNRGIGLAAPQVGEGLRVIIVDLSGPDKREGLMTLVNPEITLKQGECDSEEGCLSVVGYKSVIKRAEKVQVQATDLDGNDVFLDAEGLLATCLQHEIDHLNGLLFIDHISRLKRKFYDKKVARWLKNKKE